MASKTKALGVGLLVAGGAALLLWSSCGASKQEPVRSPDPGATSDAVTAPPTAPSGDAASTASPRTDATGAPSPDATGAPGPADDAGSAKPGERPGSSIVRAVSGSDPRDLALLSRIERELGRTPPPEVHALIERRKQGASREELTRHLRDLPDLQLRVLAIRWIDEVFGAPDAGAPPLGHGLSSASPLVKPVTPVR